MVSKFKGRILSQKVLQEVLFQEVVFQEVLQNHMRGKFENANHSATSGLILLMSVKKKGDCSNAFTRVGDLGQFSHTRDQSSVSRPSGNGFAGFYRPFSRSHALGQEKRREGRRPASGLRYWFPPVPHSIISPSKNSTHSSTGGTRPLVGQSFTLNLGSRRAGLPFYFTSVVGLNSVPSVG